jgi:3-hydroxybutyryl-CoA dehydrogenase
MTIQTVGILGAGTMGAGIAQNAAQNGFAVCLVDRDPGLVVKAIAAIRGQFGKLAERGKLSADAAAAAGERLSAGTLEQAAAQDLVIEAVFEDKRTKEEIFGRLKPLLGASSIVATNTSSFRVSDFARQLARPDRFLGLHYFNPAAINRLVEVVRGEATAPAPLGEVLQFVRACGKEPLECKDSFGFVVNRFFCPYGNEAVRLLEEGLSPTDIDRVASATFATPLGPFAVMNIVKPRIMMNACSTLAAFGAFYRPAKTLIAVGGAEKNFEIAAAGPTDFARDSKIADRLRGAVFFPVLQLLDEAIASAAAIDLGAKHGVRFDRPPCAEMDKLGPAEVERIVTIVTAAYGAPMPRSLERVGRLLA